MPKPLLIVGAGFSGAVLARELAEQSGQQVLVLDARPHIAGNCHTERDPGTGVMVHRYGPHIFHTSRRDVWDYLDRFGELQPFHFRVRVSIARGIFSLPINLHTINQFFGLRLNPEEARAHLASLGDRTIEDPQNFEEQALKMIGRELYEAFFRGYTRKQWGVDPTELPASILKRLPVRFDYDDSYYHDPLQGIPKHGYTQAIRRILDHPLVEVKLATRWEASAASEFAHVFYTGPIDGFFNFDAGRLRYRTVSWERLETAGDFQGVAQMNFAEETVPHTRINEHKYFAPWETHERSVAFREYSRATTPADDPYYPLRLKDDLELYHAYAQRALQQEGLSFLGRLATYRYLDMHHVIGEALDFSRAWLHARWQGKPLPVFPQGAAPENLLSSQE